MDLVESVYLRTGCFPVNETYGLCQQLRRAAVSIPSNIAEGQGRHSDREFANFLSIAHGSLREVETQILIARRLEYVDESSTQSLMDLCSEVGRLITGLANAIRNRA